jgi:hypothetical protein
MDDETALSFHRIAGIDGEIDSAVSNCATSAVARHGGSQSSTSIWIRPPISGRISCAMLSTCDPTSNICGDSGCRRAKARSWPVSFDARSTVSEIASM